MKTRIVYTKIWQDSFISELSPVQKLLFIYYITNANIGLTGIYEITDRQVSFDTGLTKSQITEAKQSFQDAGKILFKDNWVYVIKSKELNSYNGEKLEKAIENERHLIPESVLDYLDTLLRGMDRVSDISDTPINHNNKSETINHKEGGVGETKIYASLDYLKELPQDNLEELYQKYEASKKQIQIKATSLLNYCEGHGKKYKNYRSMLLNSLLKDFGYRKHVYIPPPPEPEVPMTPERKAAAESKLAEIREKLHKKFSMKGGEKDEHS